MTKPLEHTSQPHILVIGDLMIDHYITGKSDRISPEAPVIVVNVQKENSVLGGAGNVVANLHTLGAEVSVMGLVGDDAHASLMSELFARPHIHAELFIDPSRPTTCKKRIIVAQKQVLRFDYEEKHTISAELEADILAEVKNNLTSYDVIVLSDYAKGVLSDTLTQSVIQLAKSAHIPVLIDPKGACFEKYRGATLLTPNRKELEVATGGTPIIDQADLEQRALNLKTEFDLTSLIVTLSEDGMAIFDGELSAHTKHHEIPQPAYISAQAREVFDVTGAGDTVLASLAYQLGLKQSLLHSAQFANTAAAVVVSKMGSATATLEEIQAFNQTKPTPIHEKILNLEALSVKIDALKQQGKRIAFTNGCFDLLHAGHVKYLNEAKQHADVLVLGLNSDASVKRLKGETRPVNQAEDRALVLAGLSAIDYVVEFEEDTPIYLIETLVPDVLIKGGDYEIKDIVGYDTVTDAGGKVLVIEFLEGRSSSRMIEKIRTP